MVGAVVCGVVGPVIPVFLIVMIAAARQPSIRDAVSTLLGMPGVWAFAFIPFGVPALLLGAGGGVLLQQISVVFRSRRLAIADTVSLGALMGSVVILLPAAWGWGPFRNILQTVPIGAATGVVCGLLVLRTLRRWGLLRTCYDVSQTASATIDE